MMYLEKGQERMAFLGGLITPELMKTRKGSVKVEIIDLYRKRGIAKVKVKKSGNVANIAIRGIIPFKPETERQLQLVALQNKFSH
jgi:hypothetical protein